MQRGLLVEFSCNPHYKIANWELCWSKQTMSTIPASGCYNNSDIFFEVTDSFHLELSRSTKQVSTRYLDNQQDSNSVINLMFLRMESLEYDNYTIHD